MCSAAGRLVWLPEYEVSGLSKPLNCLSICLTVLTVSTTSALAQTAPDSAPPPALSTIPRWSEFPAAPTNVPTPQVFSTRVKAATASQVQLSREMAAITWDSDIGEPYANASRARLKADKMKPIDPALTVDQINAFAASVRQRAVPPPVVN